MAASGVAPSTHYELDLGELRSTRKEFQIMPIRIEVVHGDVLTFEANVLALKFAQITYGVDRAVVARLSEAGIGLDDRLPAVGTALLIDSAHVIAASEVLFV